MSDPAAIGATHVSPSDSASRGCNRVFICLGSNINAERNLPAAVRILRESGEITAASTVYETIPVGLVDQPNFLNAAVLFETDRTLDEVLEDIVPEVERRLDRQRDPADKNGPRSIDLDVVLFNHDVLHNERREIPDPDILRYPFVAQPLAELDPTYDHPIVHRTLAEIAAGLQVATGDMQPRPDVRLLAAE